MRNTKIASSKNTLGFAISTNPNAFKRLYFYLRSDRDSNSGYAFDVYTLSRRASSATRASLLEFCGCKDSAFRKSRQINARKIRFLKKCDGSRNERANIFHKDAAHPTNNRLRRESKRCFAVFSRKKRNFGASKFLRMKKLLYTLIAAAALYSCDNGDNFRLSGVVEGASDETLVLQRSVNGSWVTTDSIPTDGDGEFSFESERPAYPEVLRIGRNGRYIYFPVDSIEHITLRTDTAGFDINYKIEGSDNAVWMMQVDSVARVLSGMHVTNPAYTQAKTELTEKILQNPSSIVAFYTVEKLIDGHRLFAPENPKDLKIIGAVATGYHTHRPNDPLTQLLATEYLAGMRLQPSASAATRDTIQASQVGILEIALKNKDGKEQRLSEFASSGKVILLNFTTYAASESPKFNRMLADIYKKYASQGFEIYQIGYDDNEFLWKDAAVNLPWITVYDPAGLSSQNLLKYNVTSLPCLFIIGRDGTLSERVTDIDNLESAITRYL